jgi:protein-S-isoprenylcysteine O-methyltransferase Ste14
MVTKSRVLLSFLILPGTVLVGFPLLVHAFAPRILSASLVFPESKWVLFLICAGFGIILIVLTNITFICTGNGTLAPWDPPQEFIINGPYQVIRHPMIAGVLLVLFGEIFLFRSWASIVWFVIFLIANMIYIPLVEEKALLKRFGEPYRLYRKNVPAWFPKFRF